MTQEQATRCGGDFKPRPGLILRAARGLDMNLGASFMIGDRTDIIAGARAGCRTVFGQTGKYQSPPIATVDLLDRVCPTR
jgi:D-glycero-D-manno-heptose 1,7-bisphosphate phosphatase